MTTEKKGCLAFAVCGSFCTLEDALGAAQALTAQGWTLLPVMSFAAQQNTRFGTGESWRQRLQAVTGQPVLDMVAQRVAPALHPHRHWGGRSGAHRHPPGGDGGLEAPLPVE